MENSGIKEIVTGFNNLINSLNRECEDDVVDELFIASSAALRDLLPDKHFVLREKEKNGATDIFIFDSKESRDEWLSAKKSLPPNPAEKIAFSEIGFSQVDELLDGAWDNLNYYKTTPDGELTLKVW